MRALRSLFVSLNTAGVEYCVFKGLSALSVSEDLPLDDIDLLVTRSCRDSFFNILSKNEWFLASSSHLHNIPEVVHFYKVVDGSHFHLHVYFQLISGDTFVKQASIEVLDSTFTNYTVHPSLYCKVISSQDIAHIIVLRHILKCQNYLSRTIYRNDFRDLYVDLKYASQACIALAIRECLPGISEKEFTLVHDSLLLQRLLPISLSTSLVASCPFITYRIPRNISAFVIAFHYVKHFLYKVFSNTKKRTLNPPFLVAFIGADGSGKSSLVKHLYRSLDPIFDTKCFHLGKPFPSWFSRFIEALNTTFPSSRRLPAPSIKESIGTLSEPTSQLTTIRCLRAIILAVLRLLTSLYALNLASRGKVVLCDRWPSKDLYQMDGPQLSKSRRHGLIPYLMAVVEHKIYSLVPPCTYSVHVTCPLELHILRNEGRAKLERDNINDLVYRVDLSKSINPNSLYKIEMDNSTSLKDSLAYIEGLISRLLISDVSHSKSR